jgi:type IV pilus assembly protein PilY1
LAALNSSNGWFITLGAGEKVIGSAATIANSTFFNTNQPSSTAGGGMCGSNLGIAREYVVSTVDATATNVLNLSNGVLTAVSRSTVHPGGGYLPSPVHVVVTLDGKLVEAVISGTSVQTPTGSPVGARLRNYWYKEID